MKITFQKEMLLLCIQRSLGCVSSEKTYGAIEGILLSSVGSDKCMITPHVAWSPIDTRRRLMKVVAENLAAFIAGKPINKVN